MPSKGFATNPGEWTPNFKKYSPNIAKELKNNLKKREEEERERELALLPDCDWAEKPRFNSISKAIEFTEGNNKKDCLKKLPNQRNYETYGLIDSANIKEANKAIAPDILDAKNNPDEAKDLIKKIVLGDKTKRIIKTPFQSVEFIAGNAKHIAIDRKICREQYANFFLPTLETPDEMWMTKYEQEVERVTYIKFFKDTNGVNLQAVVSHSESKVKEFLITIIPKSKKKINNNRVGELFYVKKYLIEDFEKIKEYENDIIIED